MENIGKEFNKLLPLFNEGKKYLVGKNKDIKIAIKNFEDYSLNLNKLYSDLRNSYKNEKLEIFNSIYISHIIKLSKIFLLIPYFYKAKILCEKVLELDKNNIEILPTYIKCLHFFRKYEQISEILNIVKSKDREKVEELNLKNLERIRESKGKYNFPEIFNNFKKTNNYNLDLAEYINNNISIEQDKIKGLIIKSNEEIKKGSLLMASRAIEYVSKTDNKLIKIYSQKEEFQKKLINKLKEKMMYCKEDIPEIYELYDRTNSELSLEQRKQNYIKNISEQNLIVPEKNFVGIFSNAIATKLYIYDEFDLILGIFYYPSFMSHSCVPNTKILGIGNFLFVFAERDIKKNEEITTSYISSTEEYKIRQEKLKKFYGFECQCELCIIESNKFKEKPDIKNKISNYINELIELINNPNYNQKLYLEKANEIMKFIESNNDNINNYEKVLLYYNLFCLWPYDRYSKNYNLLQKGLECCENEKNIKINILKYYILLKMYKINFVFNDKLCGEIKKKLILLFNGILGKERDDFAELLLDDLLNMHTSKDDNEIKGLKVFQFKELKNILMKNK